MKKALGIILLVISLAIGLITATTESPNSDVLFLLIFLGIGIALIVSAKEKEER